MCSGDVPRYPKEVSAKKMGRKNLNLKNLSQISETSPFGVGLSLPQVEQLSSILRIAEWSLNVLPVVKRGQILGSDCFPILKTNK